MAVYFVITPITGTAYCVVEADSEAEAIEKSKLSDNWKIDDWDCNTEAYSGGYIEAQEA